MSSGGGPVSAASGGIAPANAACRRQDGRRNMYYHAGGNVGIELMAEVSRNIRGHDGVIMNAKTAARYGIAEGDRIEVRSHIGATYGAAVLVQGVRPDTLVILGQFDHWAQPFAKDLDRPSLNTIAPMSLELTDATGSGSDIVKVQVRKMEVEHA
jgi:phenylacetyl-CoA:acceptor oxidoreductase